MDEKVSFVIYNEWEDLFEMLSIEERGLLISAIFKYHNTGELPEFEDKLKMAFSIMQKQFDRDYKKWNEKRHKRSEAGRKGAESRWGSQNDFTNFDDEFGILDRL